MKIKLTSLLFLLVISYNSCFFSRNEKLIYVFDISGKPISEAMIIYDCTVSTFGKGYYKDTVFTSKNGDALIKYPQDKYTTCICSVFKDDYYPNKKIYEGEGHKDSITLNRFNKTLCFDLISTGHWGHGREEKAEFLTINGNNKYDISELLEPYIIPISFSKNTFQFKTNKDIDLFLLSNSEVKQLFRGRFPVLKENINIGELQKSDDNFFLKLSDDNSFILLEVSSYIDQRDSKSYQNELDKKTSYLFNMYKISLFEEPQERCDFLPDYFFHDYFNHY